jgi:hypothetical protein
LSSFVNIYILKKAVLFDIKLKIVLSICIFGIFSYFYFYFFVGARTLPIHCWDCILVTIIGLFYRVFTRPIMKSIDLHLIVVLKSMRFIVVIKSRKEKKKNIDGLN